MVKLSVEHRVFSGIVLFILMAIVSGSCKENDRRLFINVSEESGVNFINEITETGDLNILTFEYMYNGGGVAIGDVNNDGLPDIYFTGNQVSNKLYINKGNLKFEDVTGKSGVGGKKNAWATGTTMVDINADGLMDIYVCYSGKGSPELRSNQLFINKSVNNGIPVFEEEAGKFNLDAPGTNSTQAAFFDFDRDGDLDMFLLNHSTMFFSPLVNKDKLKIKRHPHFSNRMYTNSNGYFTDISQEAGLTGGGNNFGLGVSVGDFNDDGWQDVYVTNDFVEQDFLLLNNKHSGFIDATRESVGHTSKNGMGCDAADYNNDGLLDIVVLDMLPEDNKRQKLLRGPDEYDKYNILIDSGYFHQYMRNTLQVNMGISPDGIPVYSEIGQLAGISNTDWSWAPLLADFDNDGLKDLFVSNGFFRDFTNLDFLTYTVQEYRNKYKGATKALLLNLVNEIPQTRLKNYLYRNNGDLTFTDHTESWGFEDSAVSNGAAYADLDNDGDLDIVINHIGKPASIYRNNSDKIARAHYLKIKLEDTGFNRLAIGARITVETQTGNKKYLEMQPTRGFQSSVDPILHVGLGNDSAVRKISVRWPDGVTTESGPHDADQLLVLNRPRQKNNDLLKKPAGHKESGKTGGFFTDITDACGLDLKHKESEFVDFNREFLLPYQLSREGPRMATGDVNGDGLDDLFIGAAKRQSATLFLQTEEGKFVKAMAQPWTIDSLCEDGQSMFFDADGDGDMDLYVVSGSIEPYKNADEIRDRLYVNNGKGRFRKSDFLFPGLPVNKLCVAVADYNKDNKPDIFVGSRTIPGSYGTVPESFLFRNESSPGKINFVNIIKSDAPDLADVGMVTDACWTDVNQDGWLDLIVVGDWMPVKIFINQEGLMIDKTREYGLSNTGGIWTRIIPCDLDGDSLTDYILGSLAANTQFKASIEKPMTLHVNDYLKNGSFIPIICYYPQNTSHPYATRDEITEPIPSLKKKFLRYSSYANATINDIFTPAQLEGTRVSYAHRLKNSILKQSGGKFIVKDLPPSAQFSAIQAAASHDFDADGRQDVFSAGNFYSFRTQLGRSDAGKGILLQSDTNANVKVAGYSKTGVNVSGDVRDMVAIRTRAGKIMLVISKNNDKVQVIGTR